MYEQQISTFNLDIQKYKKRNHDLETQVNNLRSENNDSNYNLNREIEKLTKDLRNKQR